MWSKGEGGWRRFDMGGRVLAMELDRRPLKIPLRAIFGQMKLGIGGNFHWHCAREHEYLYVT